MMIFNSVSCRNYFLVKGIPNNNITEIENIKDQKKPVVIHWHNSTYDLNEVTIDSTSISGLLSLSTSTFEYRYQTHGWNKVYKRAERNNINTAHIYLLYSHPKLNPGLIKIDSKDINKIEIVEKNSVKTTLSHVFGWSGIAFGVFVIIELIVNPPVSLGYPFYGY